MTGLQPLGEVIHYLRGITFKPEEKVDPGDDDAVVCMRTKNVQDVLDQSDLIAVPSALVRRDELYLREGDILLSSANSWNLVGKVCQVPQLGYKATAGGFISVVRPRSNLDSRYLYRWLASPTVQERIRGCARQTTNISNLSVPQFEQLVIPVPPLMEQRRIADVLDKADAIRRKRREAIALTEELLRSVFLEMFGDPVTNPRGWSVRSFGSLGELDRGRSRHRPRNDPRLLGGRHPLIQTGEVANCDGVISSFEQTYSDLGLAQSRMWPAGTLCITIAANIAKTGVLGFDACFPDSVVGFTPGKDATTEYIQYWLGFLQPVLERQAPQVAQKNINLEILRTLAAPTPPFELQRRFTAFVERTRHGRARLRAASDCDESLFQSLVTAAFSGRLAQGALC